MVSGLKHLPCDDLSEVGQVGYTGMSPWLGDEWTLGHRKLGMLQKYIGHALNIPKPFMDLSGQLRFDASRSARGNWCNLTNGGVIPTGSTDRATFAVIQLVASLAQSDVLQDMVSQSTLWLFNIAMEIDSFIDGLPIKNGDFPWLCNK